MNKTHLHQQEQGFAALIVAIIVVIILSLITVGFAELMRHELDQSTNRQLSNEAYYAAESGINDALRAIQNDPTHTLSKQFCGTYGSPGNPAPGGPGSPTSFLTDNSVDTGATGNTQWTCLLINSSPTTLEYSPVDTITPTIVAAQAVDSSGNPTTISSITIKWKDAGNSSSPAFRNVSGYSNNSAFPASGSWNDGSGHPAIGMVRAEIVPITPSFTRATLANGAMTAFLYPSNNAVGSSHTSMSFNYSASPVTVNLGQQGTILNGNCSTGSPFYCSSTINFSPALPATTGSNPNLLLNLRSVYGQTHVQISINGGADSLSGAQVLVDSTGRDQDILKRIQVRVPEQSHFDYPGFALESTGDICKQVNSYPGGPTTYGFCAHP